MGLTDFLCIGIQYKGMVYQMRQTNLSSLAYDQLLQSIVSFELVPGTALQERILADQLEMSRTPVREALRRLTHEGWVQNSLKRNVMEVKPLTREDIEELFEMRMDVKRAMDAGMTSDEMAVARQVMAAVDSAEKVAERVYDTLNR